MVSSGKILQLEKKRIKSKNNELGTYKISKISLSCFDDKRYTLDNEMKTLPYGHKGIYQLN